MGITSLDDLSVRRVLDAVAPMQQRQGFGLRTLGFIWFHRVRP